MFLARNVVT